MRTISKLGLMLCAAGALSFGEDYTGKLIDAGCMNGNGTEVGKHANRADLAKSCAPSSSTTAFAFQTGHKVYKFDDAGNAKAAKAVSDGLVKPGSDGEMKAYIDGEHKSGEMMVSDISSAKHRKSFVH